MASIYEILNLPQLPLGQFVFHQVGAPGHILGQVDVEEKKQSHTSCTSLVLVSAVVGVSMVCQENSNKKKK